MKSYGHSSHATSPKFPIVKDKLLLLLLSLAVLGAILQITVGGVVRVTGSGDGCPDWPTCYGQWIPPLDQPTIDKLWTGSPNAIPRPHNVLLEYSHRSIGTLLGLTIVGAVVRLWLRHRSETVVAWLASAELGLIAVVGMLGGLVVLNDLNPALRTTHLFLAEIVVCLGVLALVAASHSRNGSIGDSSRWIWGRVSNEHRTALNIAAIAAILSLIALLSGSYAVWKQAGAVCTSWPLCGPEIIPKTGLQWIHMSHRLLSLASVIAVLLAGHRVWRLPNTNKTLRAAALGSAVLIFAQMMIGAANPWTAFSVWARASHLSIATVVWIDMVLLVALILRPVPKHDQHMMQTDSTQSGTTD